MSRTRLLILAVLWLAATGPSPAEPLPAPEIRPTGEPGLQRVLFVGNSYLYYNDSLHNHVRRMAEMNGPFGEGGYTYKSATIGGARLWHHPFDHLLKAGNLGVEEPFQFVVLQGGSNETLSADRLARFRETVTRYVGKVRATGARAALYMTHAYVVPHPNRAEGQTGTIARATIDIANELDILVIPVGLAFERAYAERPHLRLHETFDGSHPNLLGTFLAACVVYRTLYDRPAEAVAYDYFGEVGADDAAFLRSVADRTVAEFFASQP